MVLQANYNVQYIRTIFCCFHEHLVFICLCSCFYVQLVFICLCSSYVNHLFLAIYVSSIIYVVLAIDENLLIICLICYLCYLCLFVWCHIYLIMSAYVTTACNSKFIFICISYIKSVYLSCIIFESITDFVSVYLAKYLNLYLS